MLPNGEILDTMSTLRKDNTGYDLKQLFIGSEGTLGIVTEVAMLCGPLPSGRCTALLGCKTYNDVLEMVKSAKVELGDILSIIEYMDAQSIQLATTQQDRESLLNGQSMSDHFIILEVESYGSTYFGQDRLMKFVNK